MSETQKRLTRMGSAALTVILLVSLLLSAAWFSLTSAADEESPVTDPGISAEKENKLQGNGGDYTDNVTVAKRLDVVFSEFPVGSFFSYTGRPCTCHNKCSYYGGCDCISDYNDPEKGGKLVRLYSIQCMGFAHYTFYKLFGFIDSISYPENASKYYSLGSLSSSKMTVENVKKLFSGAKTGADVRILGKHSLVVLSTDSDGLYVLQANWVSPCMVNIKYWTWEEFTARYKAYGIEYVNMPMNYPASAGTYVPPVEEKNPEVIYLPGTYRVTASVGLRLRSNAGLDYPQTALIPDKTVLVVSEVQDGWGKTTYNGHGGWIFLEYTELITPSAEGITVTVPAERRFVYAAVPPDFSSLTVQMRRSDGTLQTLSAGSYTLSYSFPKPGKYTVSVAVGGLTSSFEVTALPAGDLDQDGTVSAADVMFLLRYAENGAALSSVVKEGADLNRDGNVNRTDAELLVGYLTGTVAALPVKGDGE